MSLPAKPNNRKEAYLSKMAGQDTDLPASPQNREEAYLDYIARNGGGGGGGGDVTKAYVDEQDAKKVDKIEGKGLSTNDYDDTAKSAVDNLSSALAAKANKNEMSVEAGTGADADKTTITLKENMSATVLNAHQDISGKADKVSTGTPNGKLASLNETGNLADSGVMADMTSATATGNPLSFTTDSTQVAQNTVITFEPIQAGSGDPSPTNVREIEGYVKAELAVPRKNLFKNESLSTSLHDVTFTVNDDGTIKINGTASQATYFILKSDEDDIMKFANGQTYKLSGTPSERYNVSLYYSQEVNGEWTTYIDTGNGIEFTPNPSRTADALSILVHSGDSPQNAIFKPMITLANQPNSDYDHYEPYNPLTDISEQLPTTLYGFKLNVESGELVVDRGIYKVSASDITFDTPSLEVITGATSLKEITSSDELQYYISSHLKSHANTAVSSMSNEFTVNNANKIIIRMPSTITTAQQATDYFTNNDVYVCGLLAQPYTIKLTPHQVKLLLGSNTVTTNGNSISLTYRKGEVAKLSDLEGIAESVEGIDKDKVSKSDITDIFVNGSTNTTGALIPWRSHFYLNDVLCRAIADIAINGAFTKNTNYEEVNISDTLDLAPTAVLRSSGSTGTELSFDIGSNVSNVYLLIGYYRSANASVSNKDGFALIKRNGTNVGMFCKNGLETVTGVSLTGNTLKVTVGDYMSCVLVKFI